MSLLDKNSSCSSSSEGLIFQLVTSGDMSADLPASFSLSKYQPAKPGVGGRGCGGAHTINPTLATDRIPSCSEKPLFTPRAKEARQERKHEQVAGWAHHLHNEQNERVGAMGVQGGWNGEKKRNFFFLTLEGIGYTWHVNCIWGRRTIWKRAIDNPAGLLIMAWIRMGEDFHSWWHLTGRASE